MVQVLHRLMDISRVTKCMKLVETRELTVVNRGEDIEILLKINIRE
jgi:hypothetical protein